MAFNNDFLYGIIDNNNGYRPEDFEEMSCLQDADLNVNAPLDISFDYGHWFNGIVTGQEDSRDYHFRFLSAMSIDENEKFEQLLHRWCNYYRFHKSKVVDYWYDHTALNKDGRSEEYPDIVKRVLSSYGWWVNLLYIGHQPSPNERYLYMGYVYGNDHPEVPKVTMNRHHCKYLIISMNGAKAKQGSSGTEKDKADEKNQKIDQRTTTHFSDAHDTLLMGKYAGRTAQRSSVPPPIMGRN